MDISTLELALQAVRLGGIGHISDAMSLLVVDKTLGTRFTKTKAARYSESKSGLDKSSVKFDLSELREAQCRNVEAAMSRKKGDGGLFINIMEKLIMPRSAPSFRAYVRSRSSCAAPNA